jgi:hypothetical protein
MVPLIHWHLTQISNRNKNTKSKSSNKSVGAGIAKSVKLLGYRLEDRTNVVKLPDGQ